MSTLYTRGHEWIRPARHVLYARVGLSRSGAQLLGSEVCHIDLPHIGDFLLSNFRYNSLLKLHNIAFVHPMLGPKPPTHKMRPRTICIDAFASEAKLHVPCDGWVVRVNERLRHEPWLVSQDPEGEGWLLELHLDRVFPWKKYLRRRAGGPRIRSMIRRLVRPLPRNLVLKKLPIESHDTDGRKMHSKKLKNETSIVIRGFWFQFGEGAQEHTVEM